MYFVRTPSWIQWLLPQLVWRMPTRQREVYLTFDDGPIPEVTPWILDLLNKHGVKATFFCVGDHVRKHPEIYQRILDDGHAVGNHTFHHINAWKEDKKAYLSDIAACNHYVQSKLFRPPYGKLRFSQMRTIRDAGYKIIMWDLLTGDFDQSTDAETCFQRVTRHIRPGSILVFHDSLKAWPRLEKALPMVLEELKEGGWVAKTM